MCCETSEYLVKTDVGLKALILYCIIVGLSGPVTREATRPAQASIFNVHSNSDYTTLPLVILLTHARISRKPTLFCML